MTTATEQQAERDRVAKIESDRKAEAVRAEMAAQAEAQRVKAEREQAEWDKAEAARLEALKPDIEKLHDLGARLRLIPLPSVDSKEAASFIVSINRELVSMADRLEQWGQS